VALGACLDDSIGNAGILTRGSVRGDMLRTIVFAAQIRVGPSQMWKEQR
jgi:hypothetical protein